MPQRLSHARPSDHTPARHRRAVADRLEPRVLWAAAIFNATETAHPGDVFGLQGHDFGASPRVFIDRVGDADPAVQVPLVNASPQYVSARVPPEFLKGQYEVWVDNGSGVSGRSQINRARPTTVEFDDVAPGGSFRIWGRNMAAEGGAAGVRLVSRSTGTSYAATVTGGDQYVLNVTAPADLLTGGSFDVWVNNGWGGAAGDARAGETIAGRTGGTADPFDLKVSWGADFAAIAANVYDVKTDARLALKAAGDGVTNDRDAIRAAVGRAAADGGGVVYLPAGTYRLDYDPKTQTGIAVPANVVLRGAGIDATTVNYGYGVNLSSDGAGQGLTLAGTRSGVADVTVRNVNPNIDPAAGWFRTFRSYGTGRNFLQRVALDTNHGEGPIAKFADRFVVADSRFNRESHSGGEIFEMSGSSNLHVRNNLFTYDDGRLELSAGVPAGTHVFMEDNRFVADAAKRVAANGREGGGIEFSGVKDIVIKNNRFEMLNRSQLPNENDGETILSQYSNPANDTVGTVTASTATTVTDTGNSLPALARSLIVAIVDGPGTGQWRSVQSNTANTITVDRPWDVAPGVGSRYVVTGWASVGGAVEGLIQGNQLTDQRRGIWFYTGGADVAIAGNRLTNAEGIFLVADDRTWFRRFNLLWNMTVTDNVVRDTDNRTPAYVGAYMKNTHDSGSPAQQPDLFGVGILGMEFRRNTLQAYNPDRVGALGGYGYESFHASVYDEQSRTAARDTDTVGILGTIFQDNTAINTDNAYRVGTGTHQTAIWDAEGRAVTNLVLDSAGAGVTQKSVGTVVGSATVAPLAAPWVAADVGAVGMAGRTIELGGGFEVRGSGADIWAAADEFQFVHQLVRGDVELVARVAGLEGINPWTKAGLMVRESLAANARNAAIVVTPSNGASFQHRAATGGTSASAVRAGVTAPEWVRLLRIGNTLTGYVSATGAAGTWVQIGSTTVTMAADAYVGLAVTSHDDGLRATAAFDGVRVTPLPAAAVSVVRVNDGAAQRSMIRDLTVTFDQIVAPQAGAFELARRGGAGVALSFANPSGDGRTFVLTPAGSDLVGGSLADGVYELTVRAPAVLDAYDRPLAADRVVTFHRLFGDGDGNRAVNSVDSRAFNAAFGATVGSPAYVPWFDYDGNGAINGTDSRQFQARFGTSVIY